jgi:type I site-specific restriction-modification system R (restriction) subunit
VYPGKDFGLIVDYNGMLKSLREALAQYALGDDDGREEEIVAPIGLPYERLRSRSSSWLVRPLSMMR